MRYGGCFFLYGAKGGVLLFIVIKKQITFVFKIWVSIKTFNCFPHLFHRFFNITFRNIIVNVPQIICFQIVKRAVCINLADLFFVETPLFFSRVKHERARIARIRIKIKKKTKILIMIKKMIRTHFPPLLSPPRGTGACVLIFISHSVFIFFRYS